MNNCQLSLSLDHKTEYMTKNPFLATVNKDIMTICSYEKTDHLIEQKY